MTIYLKMFFCIACLFTICSYSNEMSAKRKIAYAISHSLANKFEKIGLTFSGISEASKDGKYQTIELLFNTTKTLTKAQGKKLILECAEDALTAFNSSFDLRPYMNEYPFTGKNINISIYVKPNQGKEVFYPDVCIFNFFDNSIEYATRLNENSNLSYETDTIL